MKNYRQHSVCCYAGATEHQSAFEQLSANIGQTEFFEHLFLTSSSAILFGLSCRLTIIKCQHSSKPWALAAISKLSMQKTLLTIFILSLLLCCRQIDKNGIAKKDTLFFRARIAPAFDEPADVTFLKSDSVRTMKFILKEAHGDDKPVGVFYTKTITVSEEQFNRLDSELFKEISISHSIERHMRDGIGFRYQLINNADTSVLSFSAPYSKTDSAAFLFIETSFNNFRSLFKDTIINEYLDDMETYIDYSKKDIMPKTDRAISKLRKLKYSR